MRIIKPHGRSVTKKDHPHNRRILCHKKNNNLHDLEDFALRSPDLVIAQWISVLDKIIKKPIGNKKASSIQHQSRETISQAMWPLLKTRLEEQGLDQKAFADGMFMKKWQAKVHPYSVDKKSKEKQPRKQGKWYETFCGKIDPDQITDALAKDIAAKIEQHLYKNQRRVAHHSVPKQMGLIPSRAKSIEQNTLKPHQYQSFRNEELSINPDYFNKSDVAKEIYVAIKNERQPIRAKRALILAAKKLQDHYARIFVADNGTVMPIHEAKNHPLFASHQLAKEAYRHLFKRCQKKGDHLIKITESSGKKP